MFGWFAPRHRVARSLVLASTAALTLTISACGRLDEDAVADVAVTSVDPSTTAAPTTTLPASSVAPTAAPSTSTTTTMAPPIVTPFPQPTAPIAPPADPEAAEPVIEMGTISIPDIDVSMTMFSGIRETTLDLGPGHWPGSALPGQVGNVVVAGHRTSSHKVFRDVDQLEPGDEIIFDDANGRHVYRVTRTEIVEPTAIWIVDPTPTPTATLFACHPPGSTAQRIVVFADLVTT